MPVGGADYELSAGALSRLDESSAHLPPDAGFVPHVVAWNLTKRCNLECAHCYISAGPDESATGELTTEECLRIAQEILSLNSSPMFILSGGEPLLRSDLTTIASFASERGATVVVGTNGTLLTDRKIEELRDAGVSGFAVSVESLNADYHDRFRRVHGSLAATLQAVDRLAAHQMDFVIQTTLTRGNRAELEELVKWADSKGAVSFNGYFVVATGRATRMDTLSPVEFEDLLSQLVDLHVAYMGRMMVRAKCAPQFMRLVYEKAPDSPVMNYPSRCPCGLQYCRITPDGKLTACPYMPVAAGDLRKSSFEEIWSGADLFTELRTGSLGGKCGRCGYRSICGGCRARAFASDGSYLSEDPSCTYQPDGSEPLVERPRDVTYGDVVERTLEWAPEALERVNKIPSFVRGVVTQRIESYARKKGLDRITLEMLTDVRRQMPIDFSKRSPFFLRND